MELGSDMNEMSKRIGREVQQKLKQKIRRLERAYSREVMKNLTLRKRLEQKGA